MREIANTDAVVKNFSGQEIAQYLKADKKLKWVAQNNADVENTLSDKTVRNFDIILTSAKIIQGPEIA